MRNMDRRTIEILAEMIKDSYKLVVDSSAFPKNLPDDYAQSMAGEIVSSLWQFNIDLLVAHRPCGEVSNEVVQASGFSNF